MTRAEKFSVTFAACGIFAHFILSVVLAGILLTSAYAFSDGAVGSVDDLRRLGDSPRFGFYGLALSGILDVSLCLVAVLRDRTRVWAWTVPVVLAVVSVVVVLASIAGFQTPAPAVGG